MSKEDKTNPEDGSQKGAEDKDSTSPKNDDVGAPLDTEKENIREKPILGNESPQIFKPIRIAFFVNNLQKEEAGYTTTRLSMYAHNRGHQVYYITPEDFAYDPDEKIRAWAVSPPKRKYKATGAYLNELLSEKSMKERISVSDLDVVMLRNDPATEPNHRAWAQQAGLLFTKIAIESGVIVLNDPKGLSNALNKMYFQHFPKEVRPETLITRNTEDIKNFAKEFENIVIKPLQGSGGANVFMIRKEDIPNMHQMIDAVTRDGYVIAQEYLTDAEEGDTRLFLMNGQPLKHRGKYAAFRRVRHGGDLRSNIHAGGKKAKAIITEVELRIAEIVRPKLVEDGMFFVGLDIVGDKLMEINVFTPGGLGSAQSFEKVNFCIPVLNAIEKKVRYMEYYRRDFDNCELATL